MSEDSNSVKHARTELALIGEEESVIEWYVGVIKAYHKFGHSGGSFAATLPTLISLLNQENLSPITSHSDEWHEHAPEQWDGKTGIWQNKRNGKLFSTDGGLSYYNVDDAMPRVIMLSKPAEQ